MGGYGVRPTCERLDCIKNSEGCCTILIENDFGERSCPFYKQRKRKDKTNEKVSQVRR